MPWSEILSASWMFVMFVIVKVELSTVVYVGATKRPIAADFFFFFFVGVLLDLPRPTHAISTERKKTNKQTRKTNKQRSQMDTSPLKWKRLLTSVCSLDPSVCIDARCKVA